MSAGRKSARSRIRSYRKSGAMFGQTFHTGIAPPETSQGRALTCARLEVSRWFGERNKQDDPRHARACVREAVQRLRDMVPS